MQHINQNPLQTNEWSYTNNTDSAQNIIVTLNGGDGALSKSTWVESDWTKYWSAGARGVSVQCFINDTLQEVAQGGLGNPQSIADQKRWVRKEAYKCGRYWYGAVKWCDRDVYDWTYTNRAFPRGGSGDTKSFALNLGAGEVLKIVFVGGANITNTLFNGSVSLSFIPQTAPVIPEVPEVEPSPESPETELPEVNSSENAENTEQETLPALSREQILAYQSFLGDFMEFFTQNQNQKITENMTFLDYYNANKSEANEPYESFLSSQLMANGGSIIMRDFLADFMPKHGETESELVEFFANMPQTQHKDGDLLDLSYFELIGLLGEQGGDSSQGNTESENTENENPPIVEPETPEVEAPQEPQTQEQKLARIQEIKQNALVSEFLSVKKTFADYHNLIRQNQNPQNNATPTTPEQIQQAKNNQLIFDWFMSWLIDPTHTAELEDMPKSQSSTIQQGEAIVNQALAKWVLKIPNLNEIYADLQSKGMSYTLDEFKIMLVCFFDSVNAYKDSFESERNRYVEIYAMPEIRALIDELEKLEAEVL